MAYKWIQELLYSQTKKLGIKIENNQKIWSLSKNEICSTIQIL